MTTEPDYAMAWARENAIREAVEHGFSDVATKIQRGLMPAYVLRDADCYRAGHAARDAEVEALRAALHDAINSPKGVVPASAEAFYDQNCAALGSRKHD